MKEEKKLVRVLAREALSPPPVWFMRQAGRYLPEYRALRAKAGMFWTMCQTPELACEITLQPVRRYGLDAAILFSDILVVPSALGVAVTFEDGEGPRLAAVESCDSLVRDPAVWAGALAPAYDALRLVRARLDGGTALLGFAGAPWTIATYMAQGGGSGDQRAAKLWGYSRPESFANLLALIGDCVAQHLVAQLDAGADAVQLFDSWASGLSARCFSDWVISPTKRVVDAVRKSRPDARIIGFPRAATLAGYERYAVETGVDAVSVDTAVPMAWAAKTLGGTVAVQGNLDPIVLLAGGPALHRAVDDLLGAMRKVPFVFNLGHGVLQETPLAHVDDVLRRIRAAS